MTNGYSIHTTRKIRTMTQLWWNAGGAKPPMAVDNESGWSMFGNTYSLFNEKFQAIFYFDFELTNEQIDTINQLADKDEAYPGRYLNWKHFAFTHGLEDLK